MRGNNAYTEEFAYIELFGKPGLFTNGRIDRDTVPKGWHRYDLRGSDHDPGDPVTVEDFVFVNHAGAVLVPEAVDLNEVDAAGTHYRTLYDGLDFLDGTEMTLKEFCAELEIEYPERELKYPLRPATESERDLLHYSEDQALALGTVGYTRIDFGRNGSEFWHTWWPSNDDRLNTPLFKETFQDFVDDLRATGLLRDRRGMEDYCSQHSDGKYQIWLGDVYGYIAETDRYRFCLRCDPRPGMYNCYLYAYDLEEQKNRQGEPYRKE